MKKYGGVEVYFQASLTVAVDGGEWSASYPGRFTLGDRASSTLRIGGWVSPRPVWTLWRRVLTEFRHDLNYVLWAMTLCK
jgi:hypothetical protein